MPNLTKRDLVVKISNETGLVQHQVFEVIQKTLDHITSALSKGQDVELRNFGVFQVRLSKARVGRNPNIPGQQLRHSAARDGEVQEREDHAPGRTHPIGFHEEERFEPCDGKDERSFERNVKMKRALSNN